MFIRGHEDNIYSESYRGNLDLSETLTLVAITGTIQTFAGAVGILGTGTSFRAQLFPGQRLLTSDNQVIIINEVVDDTHADLATAPDNNAAGLTAYRFFVLFEVDKERGTLLWGNALRFDMGTILAVGDGVLRLNGSVLTGDSLTATRRVKVAIPDTSGSYTVQQLGFDDFPVGIVATAGTAPAAKTFTSADVTVATDNINVAAHGYSTGQPVSLSNPTTQISVSGVPLSPNQTFWIIAVDANNIKLAGTLQDAVSNVPLDITSAGAGTTTITPISKKMPAGDRSVRIAKASTKLGTPSYGNPGPPIIVTVTANGTIDIPLPSMDSNTDPSSPHDAYRIYATLQGGSTTEATANATNGPWYHARTVSAAELSGGTAGGTFKLEYADAEIVGRDIITFDNDAPGDALYITTVAGYPVLVSCQGRPTPTAPTGSAPGPSIIPIKPANLAAAPLVLDSGARNEVPLSPPELIIGQYMAAGRVYLMTANTLQIGAFTSDPDFPVAARPFWKSGFKNPYALCFVNGRLYGFTVAGPTRSVGDGEEGSEEHSFAADIEELTKSWKPENVFVQEDPHNECVCFIHSASRLNSNGFWESEMIPFMLRTERASHKIVITDPTRDMIISGAATVNGHLEFLAGGRNGLGGYDVHTYRFDAASGSPVSYSQGWQFTDGGSEDRPKVVKRPRVTGKITTGSIGIHGCAEDEEIDVDTLEAGNAGSKSGAVTLSPSAGVVYRASEDVAVSGLMAFTLNIEGTWDGVGDPDRIDEAVCDVIVRGSRK
jgi:hypothetical protein